jgi:tRNA-splicing ligase RtcB
MQRRLEQVWVQQMGSLGSGNHFIELCIDENQDVWVMLHSGSRGIGNVIGRYFIELAKKDMGSHIKNLPHRDLAYLQEGTQHFADYVEAVHWAQEYAMTNRREMMELVLKALSHHLPAFKVTKEAINCHHNYVSIETHFDSQVYLTRKGAIRAHAGDLGIIPGSMGTKSYIVQGKGNPDSFCSCSHGAGRRMSRSAAKERFTKRDLEQQTKGVECRKDVHVIDEIPAAYKDIDVVMENQTDLVSIVHTLKQVLCVKG